MNGYRVYTKIDGQEYKVGSIIPDAIVENHEIVNTWNWVCMGAGKQRRGRGTFRTVEDAKKALLRVCGYSENDLNFVEIQKVAA
tara:strand:- start:383 stop:634 length:252 start_codon:yes stop_codon:yes gene_type:complete